MAAPPITTATTPTSSSAARRAIPGRRWCSRTGSGCARCTTRASSREQRRDYRSQNIDQPRVHQGGEGLSRPCSASTHGFEFLDRNRDADNWLLQIETFDPHEPFHAPARFKEAFETGWNGPIRDWPRYGRVDELPEECEELRANYYAVVALCDDQLGRLLDYFDRHDCGRTPRSIVTTDHGFLLGEHDFWAKNRMNLYEEIAHIPLFVHDPRRPRGRRSARRR